MKYALLIYTDEAARGAAPPEAIAEMYRAFGRFNAELDAAGKLGPAAELDGADTARSVRVRDGRRLITDGPFAEVREQLGGIYVIDVDSLDEALDWAARIPSAVMGTIEVRPLAAGPQPERG